MSKSTQPEKGTKVDFEQPRLVTITSDRLNAREWGDRGAPLRAVWTTGGRVWVRGWVPGEPINENPIWLITGKGKSNDLQWRIWSGGTDFTMEQDA